MYILYLYIICIYLRNVLYVFNLYVNIYIYNIYIYTMYIYIQCIYIDILCCLYYIYVYVLHGSALSIAITTHLHFHGVQKAVRLVPWHQHQVMVMLNMVLAIIMDVYAEAVCRINHQGLSPMFHPTYQGKTEWYVNGMLKKLNEIMRIS